MLCNARPASFAACQVPRLAEDHHPDLFVLSAEDVLAGTRLNAKGLVLPAHYLLRGEVNGHNGAANPTATYVHIRSRRTTMAGEIQRTPPRSSAANEPS
jgi:hypothetical protein